MALTRSEYNQRYMAKLRNDPERYAAYRETQNEYRRQWAKKNRQAARKARKLEVRPHKLVISCSDTERDRWQQCAAEAGLSFGSWARLALTHEERNR